MAGLQFVLEDKARTEQKYKKQIQILQVSWKISGDFYITDTGLQFHMKSFNKFERSNRMYATGKGEKITSFQG
jgi:hypothetical protein